ncbi:MAG: tRNA lysidine(34) synthetase TilS [Phycisphaerae bacterium]
MGQGAFIRTLADDIVEASLLGRDDAVVVGVSGGADSMALLHALYALNEEADFNLSIYVAHLNHQLRGEEAEKDAAFVQAAADSLQVPSIMECRDIATLASQKGKSIEEFGRQQRYQFFERVCTQTGAKTVAVAHHADDDAETILHRVLRGTGIRGLAGIPVRRRISPFSDVEIVRPFLRYTKRRILEFLADRGIPSREDRSNASVEPMRNRIRNVVLPQIEKHINPQVRDALLRLGEQAKWVDQYLGETAQRTFETLIISRNDQQLILNAASLARKNRIIQTELIRRSIASFETGQQDIGFSNLKAVLDLVADPGSGKQVQLPGGMSVTKLYDRLVFSLPTDEPRESITSEIAVHVPGTTHLPVRRIVIECRIGDISQPEIAQWRKQQHENEEWVDFELVRLPLIVRSRRSGDRFWPLGAPGSKKLSEFLIDAKVDPIERERVPVLCDQLGPIWIVGHRLDERVKLTLQTRKALRMRAHRIEGEGQAGRNYVCIL